MAALMDSDGDGTSASALARRTGLTVATTHRLLVDMAAAGLTLQDRDTKHWTLGPLALGLGAAARVQIGLLEIARPYLERLSSLSRETSVLVLRDHDHATYVDFVEGPQRLTLREHVGMRLPLTVGASRVAILASLPDEECRTILAGLESAGHPVDREEIDRQLEDTRRQGFSVSRGAVTLGASGIAAPIRLGDRPARASIMLAVPDVRFPESAVASFSALVLEYAAATARTLETARM